MGNKRISDLNRAESLLGTEEAVVDQVADTISGFDTRKTTLSSIQEFTLSGAPFLKVTGESTFSNNAFLEAGTTLSGNNACFVGVSAIGTGPNRGQLFAESGVIAGPAGYVRAFDICSTGGGILSSSDGGNTLTDLSDLFDAGGANLQSITLAGNKTTENLELINAGFIGFNGTVVAVEGGLSANSITVNASGTCGTVPNLLDATAESGSSSILGGTDNRITSSCFSVINAGSGNLVCGGGQSFVGAGCGNIADTRATVVAGFSSRALGLNSYIGSGSANKTVGNEAFIGGGSNNTAFSGSVVLGGCFNIAKFDGTVAGGFCNEATGEHSVIVGGRFNQTIGDRNTIAGGCRNVAKGGCALFIGGGRANKADGGDQVAAKAPFAAMVGGQCNSLSGGTAFVGGGCENIAAGLGTMVMGGHRNVAGTKITTGNFCNFHTCANSTPTPRYPDSCSRAGVNFQNFAFIGSGCCNNALSSYSTVVAGCRNIADGQFSFTGAGCCNHLKRTKFGTLVGGGSNCVTYAQNGINCAATIVGGFDNCVTDQFATVVGGCKNCVYGSVSNHSFIGGGACNRITQGYGNILGGFCNIIISPYGSIQGGICNSVCGSSSCASIGGGRGNVILTSANATIAGGCCNTMTTAGNGAILGGDNNSITNRTTVHIVGNDIAIGSGDATCTTYVNNLSTAGTIRAKTLSASNAFTGSGTYTTFTIVGGVITSAS